MAENHPQFRWSFLHPKYSGHWLGLAILWFIHWLPRRWLIKIGQKLGNIIRTVNHKRRLVVDINVKLCFPNFSDDQTMEMSRTHFQYLGCALVDFSLTMFASGEKLRSLTNFSGLENLDNIRKQGNVILFTFHTTALDPAMIGLLWDKYTVCMMKRDPNPMTTWILHYSRARFKHVTAYMRDQGLRPIIKAIKKKQICFFVPDEDIGQETNTVLAPFFSTQKPTLTTISRLAKLGKARVVATIATLDFKTGKYNVQLSSPLENFPQDDVSDGKKINALMQQMLEQSPAQYMWTFKWFKTQPDNGDNPYNIPPSSSDREGLIP